MKGTPKQIEIAEEKKAAFNLILKGLFTADIENLDTPAAKLVRGTRDRINNAPASWWIENVSRATQLDGNEVNQLMAGVAQNKAWAVNGID
jgi:hypothetical protein